MPAGGGARGRVRGEVVRMRLKDAFISTDRSAISHIGEGEDEYERSNIRAGRHNFVLLMCACDSHHRCAATS